MTLCSFPKKVVVHDAGHTEVTGVWWWDRVIGMTVASWIGGLSCGWWCDVSLNNKEFFDKKEKKTDWDCP